MSNKNPPQTKRQKVLKEVQAFSLIFFLVFTFRSSFFEPFKIPSGSMIPTLVIGDFILVNKMKYGFKIPYTEWLSKPIYVGKSTDPKHGDVIVFKYPKDEKRDYIKRVIGVPCLLYTSPSPRDQRGSRMPSSA